MEIDTIKISELAEGSQINNDSILVYNLNGQTKKITFQNLKNAVISALASEVSQLDADLDAEVSARTAADTTLAGDITEEATARAAADTALAGDITAEATARTTADTALAGDISAEAAARTAADTALAGDITTEATARAAADTAITNTLNELTKWKDVYIQTFQNQSSFEIPISAPAGSSHFGSYILVNGNCDVLLLIEVGANSHITVINASNRTFTINVTNDAATITASAGLWGLTFILGCFV